MSSLNKGAASARVDSEPSETQPLTLAHDSTLTIAQSVYLTLGSDSLDISGRFTLGRGRVKVQCVDWDVAA